jgi:hypothetical protein
MLNGLPTALPKCMQYLHREHIIVAHALEDFGHVAEADAHAQVSIASEVVEAI